MVEDQNQPPPEELIRRAKAIVPTMRERAASAERERKVPQATIDDLHAKGLWRILGRAAMAAMSLTSAPCSR